VAFLWGPGLVPPLERMAEQLSHALPKESTCGVVSTSRPSEGGTVRRLRFKCDRAAVEMVSGTWAQGNTASISIADE
jgi:hypothetical protein